MPFAFCSARRLSPAASSSTSDSDSWATTNDALEARPSAAGRGRLSQSWQQRSPRDRDGGQQAEEADAAAADERGEEEHPRIGSCDAVPRNRPPASWAPSRSAAQNDRIRPSAADQRPRSTPSTSSCRTSRPRDAPTREPHPELQRPRGPACQQQVGDVRARDHEHQSGHGQKQGGDRQQLVTVRRTDAGGRARQRRRAMCKRRRVIALEAAGDGRDDRLRRRHAAAVPEPPEHAQPESARLVQPFPLCRIYARQDGEGDPQLCGLTSFRPRESFRRDADDNERLPVDRDGLPQDARISAEVLPPQRIPEHHVRLGARDVIAGLQERTEDGVTPSPLK